MNCLLLDDERPALDLLEDNAKKIPYLNIVALCRNPLEAMEIIKAHQIDLLFLDIHMPVLNGLELLGSLQNPPMVILVTAYEEHALAGFNLDVVDYLVKPVPFHRFLKAVEKAHELYHVRQLRYKSLAPEKDHVFINANYSLVRVRVQDITYIEGLKDYVKVFMTDGRQIMTRVPLKNMEEKLGTENFMRIHKSYIIALDKIESVQKAQVIISGRELPIGEIYKASLQAYISHRNL